MVKKILACWSLICPGCNIGRSFPDSFIGKKVNEHWKKGCPVNKAYQEVFGKNKKAD